MKVLPLLVALLLVPLFSWWSDWHYHQQLHQQLLAEARATLAHEDFAQVHISLDYLDVTLSGQVATPLLRFDAERLLDNLPGLRVPPRNNHIEIPAYLTLSHEEGQWKVGGLLPTGAKGALRGLMGESPQSLVDELAFHSHASSALAPQDPPLSELLEVFFRLPGDRSFHFDAQKIRLRGSATQALSDQWHNRLSALAPHLEPLLELELYPSIYHLPGYQPSSRLSGEDYIRLSTGLGDNQIYFDLGSAQITAAEDAKITLLYELIASSGPLVHFIAGGHADASGDAAGNHQLGLERATRVQQRLVEAGLNPARLEVVSFGSSKALDDQDEDASRLSRRVELLIR